jgi:hypothetical protein
MPIYMNKADGNYRLNPPKRLNDVLKVLAQEAIIKDATQDPGRAID